MMGGAGFHNEVLMLHGKMKHRQRLATFEAFQKWDNGVLFCTDVAARGLDIPKVDWILQYDPPTDPTEYIHRIGRTARAGAVGSALMFLSPQEQPFVPYLAKYGIRLDVLPPEPLPDLHMSMQRILELDSVVAGHATNAFRAYVNAYQSHVLTTIFDVHTLNLEDLAISFALQTVPNVSLPTHSSNEEKRTEYVKGKLKSIRSQKYRARAEYERLKTKTQWSEEGAFVGLRRADALS
jgi:superfamily II DNA/RNA helicase